MKIAPLTGREARLLLNYLDNTRAAIELSPVEHGEYWDAKLKLIGYEAADAVAEEQVV